MRLLPPTDPRDPQTRAAAAIALLVAASQPFYPLYLHAIAGTAAWPAWLVLLTTPAYAAIPLLAARHARIARALLPTVGVVNTLLAVKALGPGSGVELFYLPCVLLALALTRPAERGLSTLLLLLPLLAYGLGQTLIGPPLAALPTDALPAMVTLHAGSVAGLLAFSGYHLRPQAPTGSPP
jgi:hypothetical protein